MQDLLKSLYRVYCERKGQYDLPPEAEDAFQRLIKNLSKENKHLLLIVEDAHNMVSEQVAEQRWRARTSAYCWASPQARL